MTDVTDGSGPIPRRAGRASEGGAPVSGALAIVLAVVAVVAGFLILRSISDDDTELGIPVGGATGSTVPTPTSPPPGGSVATPAPTTPSTVAPIKTGATVVVANASFIGGTAGQMSRALEADGYSMGDATDAAGLEGALTASIIYYDPAQVGALPVANTLAASLGGGVTVVELPAGTPPIESGDLAGAGVLLMLGTDKAGKSLADLNPAAAPAAPAQITNPIPATPAP
jgi:hypothetical protein